MIITPIGPVFHSSKDITIVSKMGEWLVKKFSKVIEDVGKDAVVQVIMDSASNMVKACKLLVERYPHLCTAPCAAHCLHLIIEDIVKL